MRSASPRDLAEDLQQSTYMILCSCQKIKIIEYYLRVLLLFIRGWVSNRGKGLILQQMLLVSFDQHHKDHGFSRSTTLWYSYAVWQGRTATTVKPPMATIPSPKDWGSILSVEFILLFVIGIATGACSGSGIIHPIILSTSERVPNLCKPLLNHGLWQFMAVYGSL